MASKVAGERRWLAALLGLALVAPSQAGTVGGGFGVSDWRGQVVSYKERRFQNIIQQKYDYSCGSAALAGLLRFHYEEPVDEAEVFRAMYRDGDQARIRKEGFSLLDMKNYLASLGYRAEGYRLGLDALKRKAGVPAIALIDEQGYQHFVVIKGLRDGRVLVGDPAKGLLSYSKARFNGMWNGLAFFIMNKAQVGQAHFNRLAEWRRLRRARAEAGVQRDSVADFTLTLPRSTEF